MDDMGTQRLFVWLDRAFWLIWLGFPALIWLLVHDIMGMPAQLAEMAPEQAACIAKLPQVMNFTPAGQTAFWSGFAIEMGYFAVLLVMAHRVIHDCARGRVFMEGMIGTLRVIGWTIAAFPVIDLVITNVTAAVYVWTGDLTVFLSNYALDLPVLGVGLLMVTMAAAMRMAARLHRDAALTI